MTVAEIADMRQQVQTSGLTIEQYLKLMHDGFILEGAPFELLEGVIVHKNRAKAGEDTMTVGFEHIWVVQTLLRLLGNPPNRGVHFRPQQPIAIPPHSAPEPDGAIVRGAIDDYCSRYPTAQDITSLIEVADSSRRIDRLYKKRLYAQAGVRQYIIINLVDRQIEVNETPVPEQGRYEQEHIVHAGQSVPFMLDKDQRLEIPADRLLPPQT